MLIKRSTLVAAGIVGAVSLSSNTYATDDPGWYGSFNLGRSQLGLSGSNLDNRFADQGITASTSLDKNRTAFSLLGGYQFNRHFAVEGGMIGLGRFDYRSTTTAPAAGTIAGRYGVGGIGASAVGILPLGQGFSAYGKAGVLLATTVLEGTGSAGINLNRSVSHSTNGSVGLGVSYDFTKNIAGKIEWNRYLRVSDGGNGRGDIDTYTGRGGVQVLSRERQRPLFKRLPLLTPLAPGPAHWMMQRVAGKKSRHLRRTPRPRRCGHHGVRSRA